MELHEQFWRNCKVLCGLSIGCLGNEVEERARNEGEARLQNVTSRTFFFRQWGDLGFA